MMDGDQAVALFRRLGFSHVVWIPDSETGQWDRALSRAGTPQVIRPAREGEAIGIAAGLLLGGAKPLVIIQCTGFFEAGDALRNVVHDLKLPLVLVIGLRSYQAHQQGRSFDSCPVFTLPVLQAWRLPFRLLEKEHAPEEFAKALADVVESGAAGAVVVGE
jgi:sulfopyruvate decarboxylase TPP-binding subunit